MSTKLTNKEFIKRAREVHGDKYDYSKVKYVNIHTKLCIICPEHGEFLQIPNHHVNSKRGCPECYGGLRMTVVEFIKRAREVHGDKYDYSKVKYVKMSDKIKIICPEHGEFLQVLNYHINKENGCPKCGEIESIKSKRSTTFEFIEKAKKVHGNRYNYSEVEYITNKIKVCIICSDHGKFWVQPTNHISSKQGCPDCNRQQRESKTMIFIKNYLNSRGVSFEEEVCYVGLKYKNDLRIDLVLDEYNLLIEYDGIQHFKESSGTFGYHFKEVQLRDSVKNEWASKHNVNFLRIPYNLNEDNIKKLLDAVINSQRLLNFIKSNNLYFISENSDEIYNKESYYDILK